MGHRSLKLLDAALMFSAVKAREEGHGKGRKCLVMNFWDVLFSHTRHLGLRRKMDVFLGEKARILHSLG